MRQQLIAAANSNRHRDASELVDKLVHTQETGIKRTNKKHAEKIKYGQLVV